MRLRNSIFNYSFDGFDFELAGVLLALVSHRDTSRKRDYTLNLVSIESLGDHRIKWTGYAGAAVYFCSQLSFSGNLLIKAGDGLELQYSTGNIEHNTFDGTGIVLFYSNATVNANIVNGGAIEAISSSATVSCNDIYGGGTLNSGPSNQTESNGNFFLDPEFCGVGGAGNYYLQSDSPCAPGNHPDGIDCGRIGAFDVNCSTVRTRPVTWGHIKALYR